MKNDVLVDRIRQLHRYIVRTDMPRGRSLLNKELTCFFEGIDLKKTLNKGAKVLELGCGLGNTLRSMQRDFGIVPYGIDLLFYGSLKDLFASYSGLGNGIRFRTGDVESLPYHDGEFDFVFGYKSLVYTPDKLKAVKEAHRVLTIGGTAVLEIDAYTDEKSRFLPDARKIAAAMQNDQIRMDDVGIWDEKLGFYSELIHTSTRVIVNKRDNRPLKLPEWKNFWTETKIGVGVRGVISSYNTAQGAG